jgi:hypothetical protein
MQFAAQKNRKRKIGTIGIGMVVGYQVHTGKSAFKMER